jgi:hypothetical protein
LLLPELSGVRALFGPDRGYFGFSGRHGCDSNPSGAGHFGLLRWYAACCKTPIGNTLPNFRASFVGLIHSCLQNAGAPIAAPTVLSHAEKAGLMNAG